MVMNISRRSLLAAGASPLFTGSHADRSQISLEPRVVVTPANTEDFWEIDDSRLESLREDPSLYLWDKPNKLFGMTFAITAQQVEYWTSKTGYMIPPTHAVHQSLMHLRLSGRDFFMAINDNLRPYRKFKDIRIEGYYGGLMAIQMYSSLYYQAGQSVPDVRLVPLVLATGIEGF